MSASLVRYAASALAIGAGLSAPCAAQDLVSSVGTLGGYGSPYVQAGYGANLVDGSYVGAPLTRVPSPREIVPSPWSYGTYGIPTVSGISRAPVGEPVVYVIQGARPSARSQSRKESGQFSRNGEGRWSGLDGNGAEDVSGGARVIQVRVPRR